MKIRKYQAGAIIYTPTPTGTATSAQQSASSSSSSSNKSDKSSDVILKGIMDQLKTDGLPADVEQVLKYAARYLDKSSHLTDMAVFGGIDKDYDLKDYIKIVNLVQQAKWNKTEYDKAATKLTSEDAWDNVAVDTNGFMWIGGEGSITKMSPAEYAKKRDKAVRDNDRTFFEKYKPLTNSELAEYRTRYFGFDSRGMISNLQGVIGMETIGENLRKIVKDFEADSVSYYKYSNGTDIIKDPTGKSHKIDALKDGFEMLTAGGPSGYYKMTNKTKIDKDNLRDTLDYLWNSLGKTEKNTLRAQMAAEGSNPNEMMDVYGFLADIVVRGAGNVIEPDFDSAATHYDPNGTGKKGGSADKGDALTQMNPLALIASGYYGNPRKVQIIGKTSQVTKAGAIETIGYDIGAMIGHDSKTLEKQTVSSLLANAWELQAGNTGSITFGNRHITAEEAQALYWNGADHLNVVKLPATKDANGNIVPDLELAQKVEKLNEAAKGRSSSEIQDYIKSNLAGYTVEKNAQGVWEITNVPTMSFLTFVAIGSDDIFDFTDEEKLMLDKVDKEKGKMIVDIYNTLARFNTLNPNKNTRALNVPSAGKNSFYKGNVFIPIEDQYSGFRVSGMDPYIPKGDLSNPAEKVQLRQAAVANMEANGPLKTNFD